MNTTSFIESAKAKLKAIQGNTLSMKERKIAAIQLAAFMIQAARQTETKTERRLQTKISKMVNDPLGKTFSLSITDQCLRSHHPTRVADQLIFLMDKYGIPNSLPYEEQAQLAVFKWLGKVFPFIFVPIAKAMLRQEFSHVILPEEQNLLLKHIRKRKDQGFILNINHLGEAILGEEEAEERMQVCLNDLKHPEIECISIKISSIYSQINLLAWQNTLEVLAEKLRRLYRTAATHFATRSDGQKIAKFIYLDMEGYFDLHLTVALFRKVLDEPEFYHHYAGIVLQSYLPDSYSIQQELTLWAMARVARGGSPIKIRLVKGANLSMERVEASQRGWQQTPFSTKIEVDANFKRMLDYAFQPDHATSVQIGIGSHNLFDIAYAMIFQEERQVQANVSFEMLEGMANPTARVVQKLTRNMTIYCPVVKKKFFEYAIAYLTRRLDEVTSKEDFLKVALNIMPGTVEWEEQSSLFSNSCDIVSTLPLTPRRTQNRMVPPTKPNLNDGFSNEPDTDWSLPHNCKWAEDIIKRNKEDKVFKEKGTKEIESALETAKKAEEKWSNTPVAVRSALLAEVAQNLRIRRADLISDMIHNTNKTIAEADTEISEAVDFTEYYLRGVQDLSTLNDLRLEPKGTVLVASPWNFPCSIPTGGIAAAIATGNCVIFKPAPEAIQVGWQVAKAFWDAGISQEVLQFIVCDDEQGGSQLIKDPRISSVILTGGTETAKHLLKLRPGLNLNAETGGKNAIIVTGLADRDLAIRDIVQSAFGYSGQKCSACSLVVLEAEVYDDPSFKQCLKDAVASLKVGPSWDPATRINPLIREPNQNLLRGLTTLEKGEEWLLEPKENPDFPHLWSPGIKWGVKMGSFTHITELFGPVLGIMRANDLQDAIRVVNSSPYGLTSGLHSLDEREQKFWIDHIEAGNCYINRGITGAIVQRQPFGGYKESSFGRGAKAGGPNYLIQLITAHQIDTPKEIAPINSIVSLLGRYIENRLHPNQLPLWHASLGSYSFAWNQHFAKDHDPAQLLGEQNIFRYVELPEITLRVQQNDEEFDLMRIVAAALTCGTPLDISCEDSRFELMSKAEWWRQLPNIRMTIEPEEQFIKRIQEEQIKKIRILSKPSFQLESAFAEESCSVLREPVLANGRLELLNYLREVTVVIETHRYGNLARNFLHSVDKTRFG